MPQRERVISDGVAYEVTKILEDNVLGGTGVGAYFGRPAAGKTGTTDNHADAWFSGYVPQLQTTVWVGYPQGEIPMENVHGISVAGGTFPATIWKLFMETAMANTPALELGLSARPGRLAAVHAGPVRLEPRADHDLLGPTTTTATTTTAADDHLRAADDHRPHGDPDPASASAAGRAAASAAEPLRLRRRSRRLRHHPRREPDAAAARRARRDPRLPRRLRRPGRRGSSARRGSATSTSTRATRSGSCTGRCPTGTSSSSTRPARSPSSCRRRPSAPRTTTRPSRR